MPRHRETTTRARGPRKPIPCPDRRLASLLDFVAPQMSLATRVSISLKFFVLLDARLSQFALLSFFVVFQEFEVVRSD